MLRDALLILLLCANLARLWWWEEACESTLLAPPPTIVTFPKLNFQQGEMQFYSNSFLAILEAHQHDCSLKAKLLSFPQSTTSQFYNAHATAIALLHAIANNHVLQVEQESNTYFLPISPCKAVSNDTLMMTQTPTVLLSKLQSLVNNNDLLDWSFFAREALRYVSRPSQALEQHMQALLPVKPFAEWEPFRFPTSRMCVQFNATVQSRIIKGMEIHAYTHSGTGIDQVLLFGTSYQQRMFQRELNRNGTMAQRDLVKRRRSGNNNPIPVVLLPTASKLDVLAAAMIFAQCDVVIADYSRNFARFTHLLSSAMRYSVHAGSVPYWDYTGNHFNLDFNAGDE